MSTEGHSVYVYVFDDFREYVGRTGQELEDRIAQHETESRRAVPRFKVDKALKEYRGQYVVFPIAFGLTYAQSIKVEREYIREHDLTNPSKGFNVSEHSTGPPTKHKTPAARKAAQKASAAEYYSSPKGKANTNRKEAKRRGSPKRRSSQLAAYYRQHEKHKEQMRAVYAEKRKDPEWVAKERERCRIKMRKKRAKEQK